jgi:hypothetical protein
MVTCALSKWTRIAPCGIFCHIILPLLVMFYYNWLNIFSQLLSSSSFPRGPGFSGSLEAGNHAYGFKSFQPNASRVPQLLGAHLFLHPPAYLILPFSVMYHKKLKTNQ